MSIPKIIHFTWKTKDLTRLATRVWKEWERTHPDYELRLWDDADIRQLVAQDYPEQLATFDAYPSGIFRADAFRFFVLHKHGGIYSDLDVLPLGNLNDLIDRTDCFVGAEPEKHVRENDAAYRGMPFLLCNAFMGSVPGHVYWRRCIDSMHRCFCDDVIDATGPRFITGIALTIPADERPDVLPPSYWSPLAGHGKTWPTPPAYDAAVKKQFRLVGEGEPAVVSHLWRNSWFMPIPYKGPSFWRIPNHLQWGMRKRSNPVMAATRFAPPTTDYDAQDFVPPAEWPHLLFAVDLSDGARTEALLGTLQSVDYPRDRLTIGLFGAGATELKSTVEAQGFQTLVRPDKLVEAELHNGMLDAGLEFDGVVLADGRLTEFPANTLKAMVSARRPVVGVNLRGLDGQERNESAFLYHRDVFKHLYRAARLTGHVRAVPGRDRLPLAFYRYLNIAPLTSVGANLTYVDCAVARAGVRFAVEPYKYHLDAEAFCIAARDKGFEVCALPNILATIDRPART